MFAECERKCLLQMARACREKGMTSEETLTNLEAQIGGFSTKIRIQKAIERAFSDIPEYGPH